MWTAIRHRQWNLFPFATTTTLIHMQVVTYCVNTLQRNKYIACECHWTQQFSHAAIADHIGLSSREGKHLHTGCASIPIAGINSLFNVVKHFLERSRPWFNISIGHAHYRGMMIVKSTGIARWLFTHFGRCLSGMQPAVKHSFPNKIGLGSRHAFIVILVAAPKARDRGTIHYIEM